MWGRVKFEDIQGHVSANLVLGLNTDEKGLEISKIWRWIVQNTTLMSFKQLCQIWTCKINSTKCPFSMSNNFIKYPKTKARKILRLSSTSLQIQGHSRPWMFVFKFKGIEGLSSFVRTLTNVDQWKKSAFRKQWNTRGFYDLLDHLFKLISTELLITRNIIHVEEQSQFLVWGTCDGKWQ
jgi:hypothetical protein